MRKYSIGILTVFLLLCPGKIVLAGWQDKFIYYEDKIREKGDTFLSGIGSYFKPALFWEKDVAAWDPVGTHLFSPIEEKIPGLDLRGLIKSYTAWPLHGNVDEGTNLARDPDLLKRGIRKDSLDTNLSRAEFLTEFQIDYEMTSDVKFTTIFNFLYDAAYDWDAEYKKAFKGNRRLFELQHYRTVQRWLRELYVDLLFKTVELRIGKQQVIWGKVDGRKVMDIINPEDGRTAFVGSEEWEWTRFPLWMVNINYFWKDYDFQYLFIPDYEETLGAARNFTFNPFASSRDGGIRPTLKFPSPSPTVRSITWRLKNKRPGDGLDDSEHAFKFGFTKGGWEAAFVYFYTWRDTPVIFRRALITVPQKGARPTPADPITSLTILEPVNKIRLHQFGTSAAKSWEWLDRQWVTRLEVLYTMDDYVQINDFRPPNFRRVGNPLIGGTPRTPGLENIFFDPDNQVKKNWVRWSFQLATYLFKDYSLSFTWVQDQMTTGWNSRLMTLPIRKRLDRMENSWSFVLVKPFYTDRMTINSLLILDDDGGGRWLPTYNWNISNYLTFTFRGQAHWGNPNDILGQQQSRDWMEVGLQYTF